MKPDLESWTIIEVIILQTSKQFYFETNVYVFMFLFWRNTIKDFDLLKILNPMPYQESNKIQKHKNQQTLKCSSPKQKIGSWKIWIAF